MRQAGSGEIIKQQLEPAPGAIGAWPILVAGSPVVRFRPPSDVPPARYPYVREPWIVTCSQRERRPGETAPP